jgi:hypothetical protein
MAEVWSEYQQVKRNTQGSYPECYQGKTKHEFICANIAYVHAMVCLKIIGLAITTPAMLLTLSPVELYYTGLAGITIIKPKLEVVKKGKHCRLIFVASAVDEILQRLIFSPAIEAVKSIPGLTNSMIAFTPNNKYGDMIRRIADDLLHTDISAFDFGVDLDSKVVEADVHIARSIGITSMWKNVIRNLAYVDCLEPCVTLDGIVIVPARPGVQRSGKLDTSDGNTIARHYWAACVHFYCRGVHNGEYSFSIKNASDDAQETYHPEVVDSYRMFGISVKDIEVVSAATGTFEFCSHKYPLGRPPYPVRIWKSFARLAWAGYPEDSLADFMRDFQNHPDFPAIKEFVDLQVSIAAQVE